MYVFILFYIHLNNAYYVEHSDSFVININSFNTDESRYYFFTFFLFIGNLIQRG